MGCSESRAWRATDRCKSYAKKEESLLIVLQRELSEHIHVVNRNDAVDGGPKIQKTKPLRTASTGRRLTLEPPWEVPMIPCLYRGGGREITRDA